MEEEVRSELATEIVHLGGRLGFSISTQLKLYLESFSQHSRTRLAWSISPCFLQLTQELTSLSSDQGIW